MTPFSSSSLLSRRTILQGLGASMAMSGCGGAGATSPKLPPESRLPEVEAAWREHLSLQEEQASRLRFRLAPRQLPGSLTLKLVLRDQLDRDWIFKLGEHAMDGAVAFSKLAVLTGVSTPFCIPATLPINGTMQSGQLQPFVENVGTVRALSPLSSFPSSRLSRGAWDDLVRNHALSWIGLNHHVHVDQFLLIGTSERVKRVVRVDNAVAWHLLGQDALTVDFHCPALGLKVPRWILGYRWFWTRQMLGSINLDLGSAAAWIGWVSRLPRRLIDEVFSPGVEHDFVRFANMDNDELRQVLPDLMDRARKDEFLPRLGARLENAEADLFSFYERVQATRNEELARPDRDQVLSSILGHLQELDEANEKLRLKVASLDDSNPQESISAVLSVESYDVLREIVNGNTIPLDDSERHAVYRKGIEELETLLGTADNPCETRAIELSITELQRRKPQPYDQQEMMDNRRKLAKLYPLLPCAEGQTGP